MEQINTSLHLLMFSFYVGPTQEEEGKLLFPTLSSTVYNKNSKVDIWKDITLEYYV